MVVANDVTYDSRVLREAAVLAAAGHHVTILGMMTARTTAPEVEVRDGYVIRRLRYRAQPPNWWIPPDFYGRIRYRASRQYRVHRARLAAVVRHARRQIRSRSLFAVPRMALRRRSRVLRPGRRAAALRRRLASTPLRSWPTRAARLSLRTVRRAPRLLHRGRRDWERYPPGSVERAGGSGWSGPWFARRVAAGGRLSLGAAWRGLGGSIEVAGGVLQFWVSLGMLLAWGSVYLFVNRASGGALEWLTGWSWRWLGWAQFVAEHAPDADVWHAHDMTSLPAVVELKRSRGGISVYDSHEIYLESGRSADQPRWAKARLEKLERELAGRVDAIVTVNRSVADILAARLGRKDITVLHNCPPRAPVGRGSPIRRVLGLSANQPIMLYHGSLAPHRGVEQLLAAATRPELGGVHLVFLGFGPLMPWLREEATATAYSGRVHVLDAIPPDELSTWLRGVDVAVAPIQPSTLNHRCSSPNKVFEAIAVGTPVAGSDFPEFRRVIADERHGPLGVLFDPTSPDAIAEAVRQILDLPPTERAAMRRRCRRAAALRWNWATESTRLLHLYDAFSEVRTEPAAAGIAVVA